MRFIFWCEFPDKTDWTLLQEVLKDINLKITIYVASESAEKFTEYKRIIKSKAPNVEGIFAWPVLPLKDGYWFSGFTPADKIKKILTFRKYPIKLDLEPPFPGKNYSHAKVAVYLTKWLIKKAPNSNLLAETVKIFSKKNRVLVNELPLPRCILKRSGLWVPGFKNVSKNIMAYTSFSRRLRFVLRTYLRIFLKLRLKKDPSISCSLGLAGRGIFGNEPCYRDVCEFIYDLKTVKKIGIKNCALYSVESFLNRKDPKAWFSVVKSFSQ